MADTSSYEGGMVPCKGVKTQDWYAWNNLMPPPPNEFFIIGEVYVPNPGVVPQLAFREPQGINPKILLLDLHLIQRPGNWPQVAVWVPVRYEKVNVEYEQVQVFCGSEIIADVKVQDVQ